MQNRPGGPVRSDRGQSSGVTGSPGTPGIPSSPGADHLNQHYLLLEYKSLKQHAPQGVYVVPSPNSIYGMYPVPPNQTILFSLLITLILM
jgi:hypothetical protein